MTRDPKEETKALLRRLREVEGALLNVAGRLGIEAVSSVLGDAAVEIAERFDEVEGLRREVERLDGAKAQLERQVAEQARQIDLLRESRTFSRTIEVQRREYRRKLQDRKPLRADE